MKKVTRLDHYEKIIILILASLLVFFSVGSVVKADDYPAMPINLVIPVAPGGGTDQTVRVLTPVMEKVLKTPIVIQYNTGGGGTSAYLSLSKKKPDGYNIAAFSSSFLLQQYGKIGGARMDAFDFIANYAYVDKCLVVLSSSPYKNLKDLLDYAKKNPGGVTVSNSGSARDAHLHAAAIEKEAGVKFTHVPMSGDSGALMAMLGGHVSVASVGMGQIGDHLQTGKVRILGVSTDKRMSAFPDVPTLKEQGIDFSYGSLQGLLGPKGMPENRLKMLSDAVDIGFQSDQYQNFVKINPGFRPGFNDYKQLPEIVKAHDATNVRLLKALNLYQE
jgi:tripartite-type tricarboxylate transporter receptor subunit TctC